MFYTGNDVFIIVDIILYCNSIQYKLFSTLYSGNLKTCFTEIIFHWTVFLFCVLYKKSLLKCNVTVVFSNLNYNT